MMRVDSIMANSRKGLAILATGLLTACTSSVPNKTNDYFQGKPQAEYENFVRDCNARKLNPVQAQAKLDSLAYRDLFNATIAVNDSEKVKEYNNIANKGLNTLYSKELFKNLANTGIEDEEFSNIVYTHTKYYSTPLNMVPDKTYEFDKIQHKIDSIEYRKFFEKHNLLDDQKASEFEEITENIRP